MSKQVESTIVITSAKFPPHGFKYREVSIGWEASAELALLGLDAVAKALQIVRAQNPHVGLDPGYEACVKAVVDFTCRRIPKWCGPTPMEAQKLAPSIPRKCASCGRR